MLLGLGFGWLVLSFAVCAFAEAKGRNGFAAFLAALLLSPLIGFIIVAGLADKKAAAAAASASAARNRATLRTCPRCAEQVQRAAVVCRFCQVELAPEPFVAPKPAHWASASLYNGTRTDAARAIAAVVAIVGVIIAGSYFFMESQRAKPVGFTSGPTYTVEP